MRLDKFLKTSRIIKRRTVSKNLILADRVYVNDKLVKPSYELKEKDIVKLILGNKIITLQIKEIKEYASKEGASAMYEVLKEETVWIKAWK